MAVTRRRTRRPTALPARAEDGSRVPPVAPSAAAEQFSSGSRNRQNSSMARTELDPLVVEPDPLPLDVARMEPDPLEARDTGELTEGARDS